MKNIILAVVCLVIGYSVGKFLNKDSNIKPGIPEAVRFNFEHFANREVKNYAFLQDAEEKLKAADELYAKMVVLFLADLSLKVDLPVQAAQTIWKDRPKPIDPTTRAAQELSPLKSFKQVAHEVKEELGNYAEEMDDKNRRGNFEQAVRHYKLADYVTKMSPQIKKMMGTFKGTIEIKEGKDKGQKHQIRMNFDMIQKDGKLDGTTHIELIDHKGHVYSESNADGVNNHLKKSSERPNIIFIDISPDRFISINFSTYPKLEGHYFEKNRYQGLVKLLKEN